MEIKQGYSYHIKDEFFDMVQDKYLMGNKENENYRPHFLAVQDHKNKKLYWMIPISSQVKKLLTIKLEDMGNAIQLLLGSLLERIMCF